MDFSFKNKPGGKLQTCLCTFCEVANFTDYPKTKKERSRLHSFFSYG